MNKIMEEISLCYTTQYPDRSRNFETLIGFHSNQVGTFRNSGLLKICDYYDELLKDIDFLVSLTKMRVREE